MMKVTRIAVVALCIAVVQVQRARSDESGTGIIKGTIDKPELVKSIVAVDRDNPKKPYAAKVDDKTGQFSIAGVPLDVKVDCIIDLAVGRLEGVNLKVPRSDYEEEQPLAKEDIAKLKEIVGDLNKFEDTIEIMTITGNIQHAAVILNKLRTKPFYESKPGEVIWRLELWQFERPEETWVKVQDELFLVMYRERLQKSDFDKKVLTLDPSLGGLQATKKQPTVDVGTIKLPDQKPGIRLRSDKIEPVKVEKKEN